MVGIFSVIEAGIMIVSIFCSNSVKWYFILKSCWADFKVWLSSFLVIEGQKLWSYIYIYIYIYSHTPHTHIYVYIYIYI